jgi:hypothetical protein
MMDEWEKTSEGKPPVVNIHDWMQRLTLDALGFSIFNYDIGAVRSGPNPLVDTYHQAISVRISLKLRATSFRCTEKIFLAVTRRNRKSDL